MQWPAVERFCSAREWARRIPGGGNSVCGLAVPTHGYTYTQVSRVFCGTTVPGSNILQKYLSLTICRPHASAKIWFLVTYRDPVAHAYAALRLSFHDFSALVRSGGALVRFGRDGLDRLMAKIRSTAHVPGLRASPDNACVKPWPASCASKRRYQMVKIITPQKPTSAPSPTTQSEPSTTAATQLRIMYKNAQRSTNSP